MNTITCYICKEEKEDTEYSWKVQNLKRCGVCKECHRAYRKKHYDENKQKYIDKARKWNRAHSTETYHNHKLTRQRFEELLAKHEGMCWACKNRPAIHIDHDHTCCEGKYSCGKCVRGLLCFCCNTGLGILGDNIDSVQKVLSYLEAYALSSTG